MRRPVDRMLDCLMHPIQASARHTAQSLVALCLAQCFRWSCSLQDKQSSRLDLARRSYKLHDVDLRPLSDWPGVSETLLHVSLNTVE